MIRYCASLIPYVITHCKYVCECVHLITMAIGWVDDPHELFILLGKLLSMFWMK